MNKKQITKMIKKDLEIAEVLRILLKEKRYYHYEDEDPTSWNNEIDGIDYHIRKLKEILSKIKQEENKGQGF